MATLGGDLQADDDDEPGSMYPSICPFAGTTSANYAAQSSYPHQTSRNRALDQSAHLRSSTNSTVPQPNKALVAQMPQKNKGA